MKRDFWGANKSRPDKRTEFNKETFVSRGSDEEKLLNEESIKTEKLWGQLISISGCQNTKGVVNRSLHIKKRLPVDQTTPSQW